MCCCNRHTSPACCCQVSDPAGVGGLVGYSVRLDSKVSQYTRLMFCTTGVLLRRLMSDPQLAGAAAAAGVGVFHALVRKYGAAVSTSK
jgi:hypothetical protein